MHRLLRGLLLAGLLLAPWTMTPAEDATGTRLLLLANDPTRPGFLAELESLASGHGLDLETGFMEALPPDPPEHLVRDRELVVVFAPSHGIEHPERLAALRQALADSDTPLLVIHREHIEHQGLADDTAGHLASYFTEGGERNLDAAFRYVAGPLLGLHDEPVPPPRRYPDHGIYHPDFEGLVFPHLEAYRDWYGDFGDRPVIGVAIHDTHVRQAMTGWIDATVKRLEAADAVPLVFYVPVAGGKGMPAVVAPGGEAAIDALLFYRVSLNPGDRAEDLRALGVPVLQGMVYRDGPEDQWRADPVGFPRGSTPFYFAMAEMAGITDPTVVAAERDGDGRVEPVTPEIDALVARALNWVRLRRMANTDKRLGIYLYNYPAGAENLSASHLNLPDSLAATLEDLSAAGYTVQTPDPDAITAGIRRLPRAYHPDADLEALLEDNLAALLPLADYERWLDSRGTAVRQRTESEWGSPEQARTVIERDGEPYFVVPRLQLGHAAILPQPPRGFTGDPDREGEYHDTDLPFSHDYLASYAWLHTAHGAHALIHFGTHGSAEFGVGKSRGLALDDDPQAVIGELPHVYPYIVDNLAEATIAKRRLRATMVSHQTPPFAPAALYHRFVDLHELVHDWESMDDGAARERVREQIIVTSRELDIHADLGVDDDHLDRHFHHYLHELHHYLHELARQSEPIGLHTLGRTADDEHLLTTVMQMLGNDFLADVAASPDEAFVGDFEAAVTDSEPYRFLERHLLEGRHGPSDPSLAEHLERARGYLDALLRQQETKSLIAALDGGFVQPSVGGDPIRNPDALPTGRNLYGFDPSRVPTRAAFETGAELVEDIIEQHTLEHGAPPERLAFTLWAMEVMRHHGVVEGQVLAALGVRPVWNDRGRLEGVELIPREELGRPRVDVLLQASGLYRDAFAGTLALLAEAAASAADADEDDNPVRAMSRRLAAELEAAGLEEAAVRRLSRTRAFSSDIGQYGLGLDGAVADVDAWSDGTTLDEAHMGRLFLERLQHAYGPDQAHWGETVADSNLFAEQLARVDAAVFARSSNLYGLLSSDDPFQYLGGLSLGAETAGGSRPTLFISNLRDPNRANTERADRFLARELRSRYHHPRWLGSMVDEGYSGTTTLQQTVENFWGWQATAPEIVRDDQWQRFHAIYVEDSYELGLEEWFAAHNPEARTRVMERMLDAARTGLWQAPEEVLETLVTQYDAWRAEHEGGDGSAARDSYVAAQAAGFGLSLNGISDTGGHTGGSTPQPVAGRVLEPVPENEPAPPPSRWRELALLLLLFTLVAGGAVRQGLAGSGPRATPSSLSGELR